MESECSAVLPLITQVIWQIRQISFTSLDYVTYKRLEQTAWPDANFSAIFFALST